MYYDENRSLVKMITIAASFCLIVSLAVFFVSNELVEAREQRMYERFLEFLTSVNAGAYDNKKAGYPPEIRIRSFEQCFDGSHYLWGKIDGYTFQGYTSKNSPMGGMTWNFTGYPNFCVESLMNAFGIGGLVVSAVMFMPGVGYLLLKGIRKFFYI